MPDNAFDLSSKNRDLRGGCAVTPRLASGVWVSAYLTRLRLADIPAFVTAKGDAEAGAVVVKVALAGRHRPGL